MARQPATGDGLGLAVDRRAEVPIGVQLAWALRTRIGDGRLTPGQRLPGLRDLAQALQVNANTVRAVYQRLEREGMIESHQGSGTYVTATARKPSPAGAIAASVAREAKQLGVDPREVAAALYVEPTSARRGRPHARAAAERRRGLREQIAALEQILARIEAEHPKLMATPRETLPARGPRLLEVEELERIQTHLIRRLAALQAAVDEQGAEPQAAAEPASEVKPAPELSTTRRARPRRPPLPAQA